jgi:hypothetical protein
MIEVVQRRLVELRAEFQQGEQMLSDLQARQAQLRETMLRISGAIQVLEELLQTGEPGTPRTRMDVQGGTMSLQADGPDMIGVPAGDDGGMPPEADLAPRILSR